MTHLAATIFVDSIEQALGDASRASQFGADLVEFRIDACAECADQLAALVERSALPCIITCRPVWEGGTFEGDDAQRLDLFEHAASGPRPPAYIDVELAAYQRSPTFRDRINRLVDHPGQVRPTTTGLILSSHDFESRPRDLYQRIEAMTASSACRVIKVAWQARSLRDNLEAFEVVLQRHKPTIALCMGPWGLPSRVLAAKFGALLTFASLETGPGPAPGPGAAIGQPTIEQLKHLYRWDAIDAQTQVHGVIGDPVSHSMSPAIHNAGFEAIGFNGVFLLMPIPPEYEHFKATVDAWVQTEVLNFSGAAVTIPHKENLLRFVEEFDGRIDPVAQRIGAANTLIVHPDAASVALQAANTDAQGALDAVCAGMKIDAEQLEGRRVAVIGAGGAAAAVAGAFAERGVTVVIYNRTFGRAQALAKRFAAAPGKVVAARLAKLCDSCCGVFINCTSVGMHPNETDTPVDAAQVKAWGPDTVVFDTVYNPMRTRLLREAESAGCLTIPGTEMFTRQAAAQFKRWTGQEAPLDVFRKVLLEKLGA